MGSDIELPLEERFITYEQMNIIINVERLWFTLAFTLRSLLFSIFRDAERTPYAADRLYNNVVLSFYNIFRLYYGSEIAQQVADHISGYITNLWGLSASINSNNTEAMNTYTVALYQVVDQLSSFLGRINLYWTEQQWRNLLYQYTRAKIEQILAIASEDFAREYELFDQITDYSMLLGDYMARGLIVRSSTPIPPQSESLPDTSSSEI